MKFRYTKFPDGSELPFVPVGLYMPGGYVRLPMLVDSGAVCSLLPMSLLTEYGVRVGEPDVGLSGLGATRDLRRTGNVELEVAGGRFPAEVVAVEDAHAQIASLGHRGFFERFRVTFETNRSVFTMKQSR